MKERLKEAFIQNYKHTLDKKSQSFLNNLDKLENYVNECLRDWERRFGKGKYPLICVQRPKVEELNTRLERFNKVFTKMVEESREFRDEYQLSFRPPDFEDHLKELLNAHINVTFPGLDNGFFKVKSKLLFAKQPSLEKPSSLNQTP